MSKIVQAVNVMVANPDLIKNVTLASRDDITEFFFTYKGKYNWSITKFDKDVRLWFYPEKTSLKDLANLPPDEWNENGPSMVAYSSDEIGTIEARASFSDLLNIVKEQMYGVNQVLDDIISDDIRF